jgi:hypothetical protein
LGYEYQTKHEQMLFIVVLYILLALGAWSYARLASKL